jgi:hypothetical protein
MKEFKEFKSYSDRSLPEAKKILAEYFYTNIEPTTFKDDTTNAIDLIFEMPRIIVSHRARNMYGTIQDITIKTQSRYGKIRVNGEPIICEYEKLRKYKLNNEMQFYYFYCFFVNDEISDYIIIDMKKLIPLQEFQNKSIFKYEQDKLNVQDGGSLFNVIDVNVLKKYNCIVDQKKHQKNQSQLLF